MAAAPALLFRRAIAAAALATLPTETLTLTDEFRRELLVFSQSRRSVIC